MERTLTIVKPDGTAQGIVGEVVRRLEANRFKILGMKMIRMSPAQAAGFYLVHQGKHFYESLTAFMSEGPVVVMALEGEAAIGRLRDLMGPTDPKKAPRGTLRGDYGTSIERNVIHGSDSPESVAFEVPYFFNALELCG
ncbi:MAG: nucleoside-diphosphate kinase [Acidobacteria bacterium]|nr:nucleoside-diphosphate kinase [Acidobacteriota bacterium]MBI3654797.1 nucleoside-diphosphate kinase [Acidobacteriota bacterium]